MTDKTNMRMIQYVGAKFNKRDTATGSDLIWAEPGSVVPVHEVVAAELLKYPDVWKDVTGTAGAPAPDTQAMQFAGDRTDQIIAVVNTMRPDDEAHFNRRSGKPRVEIIEEILGYDINAAERDEAWDRIIQARAVESHGDSEGKVATPSIDAG
jgi:hypothetical protein